MKTVISCLSILLGITSSYASVIHVPSEQLTIQGGIDVASNGDTVLVGPGTYRESLNITEKSVIIRSTDGPLATTITNIGTVDLVTFTGSGSSGSVLEGFKLLGGQIGIWCQNSGPTIQHNVLDSQRFDYWASICLSGLEYASIGVSPAIIVNNTIVRCANGGISSFSTVAPIIKNNIIAFNHHYGVHRENQPIVAQPILSFNDIYANPLDYQFVANPGIGSISRPPRLGGDWRLQIGSPCLDAGDPEPSYNDSDGSRNDMGAVSGMGPNPVLADTIRVPGDSATIQQAIFGIQDGGVILVAPGVYMEYLDFGGRTLTLVSEAGATQTFIESPLKLPKSLPVNIDSTMQRRTFQQAASVDLLPPVISIPPGSLSGTLIKGFTIDGGNSTRGICCWQSDPTITECIVQHCRAITPDGGGMWFEKSSVIITKNIIHHNFTDISGGGLFIRLGNGHSTVHVEENTLYGNIAGAGPAIALIEGDNAVIANNVVYGNFGLPGYGAFGAIYVRGVNLRIHNNTLDGNTLGISVFMSDSIDIRNNIASNSKLYGLESYGTPSHNTNITSDYNDFWSNRLGNYYVFSPSSHDIIERPLFFSDYSLTYGSPCIDAGDPDATYNDPNGSRSDIGARFETCCQGFAGNVDYVGDIDLSDLSALVSYLSGGGFKLVCANAANVNRSGVVDLADLAALVSYLTGEGVVLQPCS